MRALSVILLLVSCLFFASCGEKIAIPEAVGVPTSSDYNEVDQWDLSDPTAAVQAAGTLFVTEGAPGGDLGTLTKYNGRGIVLQGPVTDLAAPTAICIDPEATTDRNIIVAENGAGGVGPRLSFYSQVDLTPAGSFDLSGMVRSIADVVTRGDSLYIADPDSGSVLRFVWLDHDAGLLEPRGEVCNSKGSSESPQFVQTPAGLAFDGDGYLLVADADTTRNWVIRFDPNPTGDPPTGLYVPFMPNVCGDGSTDLSASVIGKAPSCGQPFDPTPGTGNGEFHSPTGLGVDADGRIYVADTGNERGQRFEGDGSFDFYFGDGAGGAASLVRPVKIAVVNWDGPCGPGVTQSFPGGVLYVVDEGTAQVRVFKDSRVVSCETGRN